MDMNVKRRRGTGWIWPEEGKEKVVVVGSSPWWGSLDGQHASSHVVVKPGAAQPRSWLGGRSRRRPPNRHGGRSTVVGVGGACQLDLASEITVRGWQYSVVTRNVGLGRNKAYMNFF